MDWFKTSQMQTFNFQFSLSWTQPMCNSELPHIQTHLRPWRVVQTHTWGVRVAIVRGGSRRGRVGGRGGGAGGEEGSCNNRMSVRSWRFAQNQKMDSTYELTIDFWKTIKKQKTYVQLTCVDHLPSRAHDVLANIQRVTGHLLHDLLELNVLGGWSQGGAGTGRKSEEISCMN